MRQPVQPTAVNAPARQLTRRPGTHAELVASDTLYPELAATQFLASTDTPGGLI